MIRDFIYFVVIILSKTIIDLFRLFGSIIIFGFILYVLSSVTRRIFAKTLGSKTEVYITGWIGTPIHELSHALFCIIFRHKINDIKLFNSKSDTIGYVLHSYDSRSWYQQMGNFFIGVAPIIIGTFIVYLLFMLLAPELKNNIFEMPNLKYNQMFNSEILSVIYYSVSNIFIYTYNIFMNIIRNFAIYSPFKSITFWIFLYLSISIASHMELSPADISHAWKGIIVIFALSLIINTFLILIKVFLKLEIPDSVYIFINRILETYNMLLIFSAIISLFNFIISYIILTPINLIRNGKLINPF
ncbi:hypothetical protein Q5M87_06880 [Brachyspira innocens]|uniref:Integral membrane protein n=1 Tax=Brachyspira innocens TaxID=13264 RepID=A0ABT8YYT7_9SPIR|nr:hypothetical protein [Brachyspira innocens]MDO6993733.1 hypothetical protein [Brachyspira innocens]MDO7020517.1 hypothetical protein [Brachyspira innocens]